MKIQWYPGHMTKARRAMQEDVKLVDLVIEVVDGRIPMSSKNPYLDEVWNRRPRIIAINKSDLADEEAKKDTMAGLNQAKSYIRRQLAATVNLRNTPELKFVLDEGIENGIYMSGLIDRVQLL